MVKTLLNNKHSQPHQNIYTNQSKDQRRKTARAGELGKLWQDKGHLENAPRKAGQPSPFSNGSGARASNTKSAQIHKTKTVREKLIHTTLHLEPRVHADMKWIAEDQGISFSGYPLKAGQLTYDCRYSTMHSMPVTGGRGFRGLKPLWYNSVPP